MALSPRQSPVLILAAVEPALVSGLMFTGRPLLAYTVSIRLSCTASHPEVKGYGMDFSSIFTPIIQAVTTPGAVAAFSVIVNIILWRAYQKESHSKDELYEKYVGSLVEIVGDYHDFAHTLDRYVEAQTARRKNDEAERSVDADRDGA